MTPFLLAIAVACSPVTPLDSLSEPDRASPTAEELHARHLALVGELGDRTGVLRKGKMVVAIGGEVQQGEFAFWELADGRVRRDTLVAGLPVSVGSDLDRGWVLYAGEPPHLLSAEDAASTARVADPMRERALIDGLRELRTTGEAVWYGTPAWHVVGEDARDRRVELWYDRETGLRVGSRGIEDGTTGEWVYRDWQRHGPVMMPMQVDRVDHAARMSWHLESVEWNPSLPAEPAVVAMALQGEVGEPIEAALLDDPHALVVEGNVEGKPIRWVLDTGAARSTVPAWLLPAGGGFRDWGIDASGTAIRTVTRAADVWIGPAGFEDQLVDVLVSMGSADRGYLGMSLFAWRALELDPQRNVVRVFPPGHQGPDTDGLVAVPLRASERALVSVELQIGEERIDALLDTGATDTWIDPELARRLELSVAETDEAAWTMSGEPLTYGQAIVGEVRLGDVVLRDMTVNVPDGAMPLPYDMVLGLTPLRGKRWVLDAPNGKLWVEP